jgi:hypothetical protein
MKQRFWRAQAVIGAVAIAAVMTIAIALIQWSK